MAVVAVGIRRRPAACLRRWCSTTRLLPLGRWAVAAAVGFKAMMTTKAKLMTEMLVVFLRRC